MIVLDRTRLTGRTPFSLNRLRSSSSLHRSVSCHGLTKGNRDKSQSIDRERRTGADHGRRVRLRDHRGEIRQVVHRHERATGAAVPPSRTARRSVVHSRQYAADRHPQERAPAISSRRTCALRFTKTASAHELHLNGTVSGWYFGNILFGGLLGIVAIDPATGAMYKLQPDTVQAALEAVKVIQVDRAP